MKLLADLTNVKKVIMDKDKALIILSSLLDEEYVTFVLTLINGKQSLSYNEVFVNRELRQKDNESSNSTSTEVLAGREIGSNHRKGNGDICKSKIANRQLEKNECAFCKKE